MLSLDPIVAQTLDSYTVKSQSIKSDPGSDDEDAILEALESDSHFNDAFREARIQQLSNELSQRRALLSEPHAGTVLTLVDEKPLMDITTSVHLSLVHFFHPDFARCAVMDGHLEALAPLHYETRFLRIDVQYAPFLVERLGVKVLPCLLGFVDGVVKERVVGFERVEGENTKGLEARLVAGGVLVREKLSGNVGKRRTREERKEEDNDDEWD